MVGLADYQIILALFAFIPIPHLLFFYREPQHQGIGAFGILGLLTFGAIGRVGLLIYFLFR